MLYNLFSFYSHKVHKQTNWQPLCIYARKVLLTYRGWYDQQLQTTGILRQLVQPLSLCSKACFATLGPIFKTSFKVCICLIKKPDQHDQFYSIFYFNYYALGFHTSLNFVPDYSLIAIFRYFLTVKFFSVSSVYSFLVTKELACEWQSRVGRAIR